MKMSSRARAAILVTVACSAGKSSGRRWQLRMGPSRSVACTLCTRTFCGLEILITRSSTGGSKSRWRELQQSTSRRDPAGRADLPHVGIVSRRRGGCGPVQPDAGHAAHARGCARHGDCRCRTCAQAPDRPRPFLDLQRALEFRPALMPHFGPACRTEPHMKIWFAARRSAARRPGAARYLLAYASDYYLLGGAAWICGSASIATNLTSGQHRSCDVVSPALRDRRVAVICHGQPVRLGLARRSRGEDLQSGRAVSSVDRPGRAGATQGWPHRGRGVAGGHHRQSGMITR